MYTEALTLTRAADTEGPEARLLRRIAIGDRHAMDGFYKLYQAKVYRFAMARLNDPAAAADILNEVMLKIWKDACQFRAEAAVQTWVLGIAYYKTMDQLRLQYRHAADELDPEMTDHAIEDHATVMERVDDAYRVQQAMASLSDVHRTALHLVFFEDLSYAAIAQVMQCPENTVKTRVFHAKQMMKRHLLQ